jgi:hypothetical protein
MRRVIVAILALGLIGSPVGAQEFLQGFVLNKASTAVTVGNTTTGTTLYSFTVPTATWANFTSQQYGATNLHLKLIGSVSTNPSTGGVGNINVGCNYGGTTATISLANGIAPTANLVAAPVFLDLYLRTTSTGAPQLAGLLQTVSAAGTSFTSGAVVVGTTSITAPQTLTCAWQWASAAATNTVTISTGVLVVGD